MLLIAVAFVPNLESAIALVLAGFAVSQMDIPTREAYVRAVVDPSERTAAAAYTNTAHYLTRPIAPLIAGPTLGLGAPFPIIGTLKSASTPASTSPSVPSTSRENVHASR